MRFHRRTRLAVLCAAALLASCMRITKIDGGNASRIYGNWDVWAAGEQKPEAVKPEITFDSGKVYGFDGCNKFDGTYQFDGNTLRAKTTGTRTACPNEAATKASQAINDLLNNGSEVVEVSIEGVRVLGLRNRSAEIALVPGPDVPRWARREAAGEAKR